MLRLSKALSLSQLSCKRNRRRKHQEKEKASRLDSFPPPPHPHTNLAELMSLPIKCSFQNSSKIQSKPEKKANKLFSLVCASC